MTLRIIAGRQEPAPGSRRERNMRDVAAWVNTHTEGSYRRIAADLGITHQQVAQAAWDLRHFAPGYYREPIGAGNRNTFGAHWDSKAKAAEVTRLKTLATMEETAAVRYDKAALETADPVEAVLLRDKAREFRRTAVAVRSFASTLEASI